MLVAIWAGIIMDRFTDVKVVVIKIRMSVMAGRLAVVKICVMTDTGVDTLAEVITTLLFFRPAFSGWPVLVLEFSHVWQAMIPSYHV